MTKKEKYAKWKDIVEETETIIKELKKHYDEIYDLENYREMLDKQRIQIERG